jgi:O-antigen ligase
MRRMRFFHSAQAIGVIGFALTSFFAKGFSWTFLIFMLLGSLPQIKYQYIKQHPMRWPIAIFSSWLLTSSLWSNPMSAGYWTHLFHYSSIAIAPLLAIGLHPALAQRGIKAFCLAATLAALIVGLNGLVGLPDWPIWRSLIHYGGNKSIANALLLALSAGLLLTISASNEFKPWQRATACALAIFISATLLWQSQSRTALFLLPVLFGVVIFCARFTMRLKLSAIALTLAAGSLVIMNSEITSNRIKEAIAGIQNKEAKSPYSNSVTVRAEMNRHTLAMISEKPVLGFGLGGWVPEWQRRAASAISASVTAHNDLLNIAAQAGVLGTVLLLWIFIAQFRIGLRAKAPWSTMLIIATLAFVWTAATNAALRDTVFSLPLIYFSAITLAATGIKRAHHD